MNNKLIAIIILFIGIFTLFTTVVSAKGNFFGSKNPTMTVILKNDAKIDIAKDNISKIPNVRIIHIQDRDKEWSRMVNKMDLPKMDNPFKNEFDIKIDKNADITDISNKLKEMNFVERIEYPSETH